MEGKKKDKNLDKKLQNMNILPNQTDFNIDSEKCNYQKMFSDELQAVASTYGQWESYRAFLEVIKREKVHLYHTETKLKEGKSNDKICLEGAFC